MTISPIDPDPGFGVSRQEKIRYVKLWGHDCARCGETIPLGVSDHCAVCGGQDAMVPLFFIADDWARAEQQAQQ